MVLTVSPRPSPYPRREPRRPVERQPAPDLMRLAALGEAELDAVLEAIDLGRRWLNSPDVLAALERGRTALELERLEL